MITDDEVLRLFERADPAHVNDAAPFVEAADYLATLRSRTCDVTIIDTDPTSTPPDSRHRRPIIAAAAAVIAIAGGALVYLVADDDTTEPEVPAGPPSTVIPDDEATPAEQIARAFIEARWSDPDQALSYFTDEVIAETSGTAERFRLEGAMFEALGDKVVNVRCEQQDASTSDISVRCAYDYHTFRSEELGRNPFKLAFSSNYDVYVIRDRKIVSVTPPLRVDMGWRAHFRQTWDEFRIWMSTQHPEDIALMYEGDASTPVHPFDGNPSWRLSEESIALWEQYTLEYAVDRAQVGFIGLPPEGAAPSTPDNAELVVHLYGGTTAGPRTRMYVYTDGRLISSREAHLAEIPFHEGAADPRPTSYLVQRLTPEGVEMLRSEVISSGHFESDLEVGVNVGVPCGNEIRVRNGDRLVRVSYTGCAGPASQEATPEQMGWLLRLDERLADPAKWLPPSAWEDQTRAPYVASRFMICLEGFSETSSLPQPATEVLGEGTLATATDRHASCTDLSTEQARTLAAALDDAGVGRDSTRGSELGYMFVDAAGQNVGYVSFSPYLPHGEAPCLACG